MIQEIQREQCAEVLQGMRKNSEVLILDFAKILVTTPPHLDLRHFFEQCEKQGLDPKLPERRQEFNNQCLRMLGKRYLIGRYSENRSALLKGSHLWKEKRVIHLGIDLFSESLEPVYAPADGIIVRTGYEPGPSSYGHYIIMQHTSQRKTWYSFFGHLSKNLPSLKSLKKGQQIGTLGDMQENGGWSRHLHYQILLELPEGTPPGYSTQEDFHRKAKIYPNPNTILQLPVLT